MQLSLGNGYTFPTNAAAVTSRVEVIQSGNGRPIRQKMYLDVTASIYGDGQAALTLQENAVRLALSQPYFDIRLKQDSGADSALRLLQNSSLSGTRVTSGPNFTDAQGPEYVKVRTLDFTAEAEFLLPNSNVVISWVETVGYVGNGGPVRRYRYPVGGISLDPIRQIVTPRSLITYTQSGESVGHLGYYDPVMLFNRAYLVNEREAVQRRTPKPIGRSWVEYSLSWNYIFEIPFKVLVGQYLPPM